jgi:hypothetical protein
MRASLGFRAGPLSVSTGNLLKSRRRSQGSLGLVGGMVMVISLVFVGLWLLLKYLVLFVYWWLPRQTWRGGKWAVQRARAGRQLEDRRSGPPGPRQ